MIIRALASMSRMVSRSSTVAKPTSGLAGSQDRHVVEAADAAELVHLQARATHQTAVDVGLRHDAADVRGLHRTAVEDAYGVRRGLPVQCPDPAPDLHADLLRVVRGGHLAGADRPHRLVGD